MMGFAGVVSSGLQAALLLARGRADGLGLVGEDRGAALRSFWAMGFCVPAVIALRVMVWLGGKLPADAAHVMARDLMVYAVATLGFAVVSFQLMPMLGKQKQWPRFIAAWNWCNVIENTLVVLGAVPGLLGAPPIVDEAAQLITMGWALWIEWYAIRVSLSVSPLVAAWLLVVDETVGLVVASIGAGLGGG